MSKVFAISRYAVFVVAILSISCNCSAGDDNLNSQSKVGARRITANDLLGKRDSLAFCYGGFRHETREKAPSINQIKEDLCILSAMGGNLLRTYNTQQFAHASRLLQAIEELRNENPDFEMYVMLGAWIDCEKAWTDDANHDQENLQNNQAEIAAAVHLAQRHPDTVKIIAVGNEAMVHWATSYFVRPRIIHKWVVHLQKSSFGE